MSGKENSAFPPPLPAICYRFLCALHSGYAVWMYKAEEYGPAGGMDAMQKVAILTFLQPSKEDAGEAGTICGSSALPPLSLAYAGVDREPTEGPASERRSSRGQISIRTVQVPVQLSDTIRVLAYPCGRASERAPPGSFVPTSVIRTTIYSMQPSIQRWWDHLDTKGAA